VVEGSSNLDQPLQKGLFRLLRDEPDRFPVFVRFEECSGMEAAKAFTQISLGAIE